jgi:G3E family GTPase
MDARHLASTRHREHPNWRDQIALADVLLANKSDLYSEADREALRDFVATLPAPRPLVVETVHGRIERDWLDRPRLNRGGTLFPEARAFLATTTADPGIGHDHSHKHGHEPDHPAPAADEWVTIDTRGDGYVGRSWLLPEGEILDHAALARMIEAFSADRLKGMVETERGWQRINRVDGQGGLEPIAAPETPLRPRIEAILPDSDTTDLDQLAQSLDTARWQET